MQDVCNVQSYRNTLCDELLLITKHRHAPLQFASRDDIARKKVGADHSPEILWVRTRC